MTNRSTHRLFGQRFLLRTHPDGSRQISWRMWVLVFVVPVVFWAAGLLLAAESLIYLARAEQTTGTVTRVYEWQGATGPFQQGTVYGPVFDYIDETGATRSASNGQSSPHWNFVIGSQHPIYYVPGSNGDVRLASYERLWALPVTIMIIGAVTSVPALVVAAFLLRWRRRGRGFQA